MKNVAGYDVSRMLAGSMGILGVICEVSLKVLPVAPATLTLRLEMDAATAIRRVNEWGGQPLPLNASAWWEGTLVMRLSGAAAAVRARSGEDRWRGRRAGDGFGASGPGCATIATNSSSARCGRWKAAPACGASRCPPPRAPLALSGEQLVEWGGAQRWLCTSAPAATLRNAAAAVGGHAVLFRATDKTAGAFAPLAPPLDRIHRELKRAFDPDGVFNPGRLVPGL